MSSGDFPVQNLRVIPYQRFSGAQNMALDYYLASTFNNPHEAVLRFYGWEPFCLSLGKHQDVKEVNCELLAKDGYDLVRRPTGGSAILHATELTYSLIFPLNKINHHQVYDLFHRILKSALNKLNYSVNLQTKKQSGTYLNRGSETFACFNRAARAEIQYQGKKLVGSAQRLFDGVVLQHGSILIDQKQIEITKYLSGDEEQKRKAQAYLAARSVSLKEIKNKPIDEIELSEAIITEWIHFYDVRAYYQYPGKNELTNSKKIVKQFIIE